jgi:hypothetical protein
MWGMFFHNKTKAMLKTHFLLIFCTYSNQRAPSAKQGETATLRLLGIMLATPFCATITNCQHTAHSIISPPRFAPTHVVSRHRPQPTTRHAPYGLILRFSLPRKDTGILGSLVGSGGAHTGQQGRQHRVQSRGVGDALLALRSGHAHVLLHQWQGHRVVGEAHVR